MPSASLLGFVDPGVVTEICKELGPFITPVLVTHIEELDELLRLARSVPCRVLQLHSDLPREKLEVIRRHVRPKKIIGKVSVENERAMERAREIEMAVDAIVLDSIDRTADRVGGTGITHDWSLSARIVSNSRVPIFLAGGLTPENVGKAINLVQPWGVDVNSGVETPDGKKSEDRIRRFVQAATGKGNR